MKSVLIIDDEQNIRTMLKDILEDEGCTAYCAQDWDEGHKILLLNKIDVMLLDISLPKVGGMEILDQIIENFTGIEVIMISGHGNIDLAVQSIKRGAFDFIEKPLSLERLLTVTANAIKLKKLREENEELKASNPVHKIEIIGDSKAIREVKEKIEQASKSIARVLITGENGTGKELIAKSIHYNSDRRKESFVEVNCAAIPENLIESELFGHEKGAFTGAVASKKGKFELAHKGMIFLDEVADMSLNTQAKVLRVLQEMEFERVGGVSTIKVDVRVLSATNKNILKEIEKSNFREDLYYRLNVIPIHSPALRERKEDIPILIDFYLEKLAKQSNHSKKVLSDNALKLLIDYPWFGNVRELKNVIERLNIMIESKHIKSHHIQSLVLSQESRENANSIYEYSTLREAKDAFEKKFIQQKLLESEMNISKTAKILEIERSHLHKKIKKYNL